MIDGVHRDLTEPDIQRVVGELPAWRGDKDYSDGIRRLVLQPHFGEGPDGETCQRSGRGSRTALTTSRMAVMTASGCERWIS